MTDFYVQAKRAEQRCQMLASISELDAAILRQYLTAEHKRCNEQVADWMQSLGMDTWLDAVGNQWGRLESQQPDAQSLIIGSHLDTVPNAGAYDGILGVMLALELVQWCVDQQLQLPFHLDVVGFCDEEGTRFGATLIGSRALAGAFDPQWLALTDAEGVTMAQALTDFGLNPDQVRNASLQKSDILRYWEAHIEQGPVLESLGASVGAVTAIAGARRATFTVTGCAGHAGTTPMSLRHDAMTAAAEMVLTIEQLVTECNDDRVATVGELYVSPGAVNVIAGEVSFSLDVRSQFDDKRDELIEAIVTAVERVSHKRQLQWCSQWHHTAKAVPCDSGHFARALQQCGLPLHQLPSGAGHDAMAMADIAPVSMLFLRSPGGLSHHPDERVIITDIADAIKVMTTALKQLATP